MFLISHMDKSPECDYQGGWELDESKTEAASRETLEEAGVQGIIEVSAVLCSFYSCQKNFVASTELQSLVCLFDFVPSRSGGEDPQATRI